MVCVNNAGSGRSVDRGERGDTCASPSTLQVLLIQSFSHLDSPISARRVSERRHQMGLGKGVGRGRLSPRYVHCLLVSCGVTMTHRLFRSPLAQRCADTRTLIYHPAIMNDVTRVHLGFYVIARGGAPRIDTEYT